MRACLVILFFLPFLAQSQDVKRDAPGGSTFEYYLGLYSRADNSQVSTGELLDFVGKLEKKRSSFSRTEDFIEFIFRKTHQRYLKNYESYVSFGQMLNSNRYNCLTATALYALLLDHFDIDYKVIETNYHIFLLANNGGSEILIEATDPVNGYVANPVAIEDRIREYRKNTIQELKQSKTYYRYNFNLYHEVNLDEILGLLHYNNAVAAFNSQKLPESIRELNRSVELYYSPRVEEFSRIVLLSVVESDLDASAREKCLKGIQSLRKKQFVVTASTN